MTAAIATVSGPTDLGIVSGASGNMPPNQKMTNLFNAIDSNGAGSIDQSQFNQAFPTLNPPAVFKAQGPDAIWNALDPNGTGSVSKQDFVNTMKDLMVQLRSNSTVSPSPVAPGQTLDSSLQSLNILA
jgi:EF-hand domain pair